ncbi:hypothetical protein GCM10009624_13150 [Gordonia sinesedis]
MVQRAWASDIRAPIDRVTTALTRLRDDAASLTDVDWEMLLGADGPHLEELCVLADAARARVTDPDALTFVVNRNLDTAVVSPPTAGQPTVEALVAEAHELGATEICLQGPVPADAPADDYLRLIDRIHTTAPDIHLHAFRPPEIRDAAHRMGIGIDEFLRRARTAGLGSVPGTAAQILDDEVRAPLAPTGTAPPVDEWITTIEAAHAAGLFSTATMLYGHIETPAQQIAHLRLLLDIQRRTGGFSELILMPLLPENTPAHLPRPAASASRRETRALHAVARLLTLGAIDHLQVAWTKLDPDTVDLLLRGGADDIGGVLLDGRLMPAAGPEAGRVLDPETLAAIAFRAGRVPVQRTTGYGVPAPDRLLPIPQVQR